MVLSSEAVSVGDILLPIYFNKISSNVFKLGFNVTYRISILKKDVNMSQLYYNKSDKNIF